MTLCKKKNSSPLASNFKSFFKMTVFFFSLKVGTILETKYHLSMIVIFVSNFRLFQDDNGVFLFWRNSTMMVVPRPKITNRLFLRLQPQIQNAGLWYSRSGRPFLPQLQRHIHQKLQVIVTQVIVWILDHFHKGSLI